MTSTAFRSSWLGGATTFLAAWNSQAVLVLAGPLHADPGVSGARLVWIVVAFDAAAATALRGGVAWSRRAGGATVLAVGTAVFAAASAGCALASGWAPLVGLRAVQGAAAAVALAAAFDDPTLAGPPTGGVGDVRSGGLGLALVGGPLLACAVAVHDWRLVFWFDAAAGVLVCAAALARRGERRARPAGAPLESFDPVALVLVGAAVTGPVGALAVAGTAGWGGVPTLVALALGLAALVPILAWEAPLGGVHRRAFAAAQTADLCLFASVSGVLLLLADYFHTVDGAGPIGVGIRMLPWSAAVAVGLALTVAVDVRGMRTAMAAGLLLHAAALLAVAVAVHAHRSGVWLAVPLALSGLGVAWALPATRFTAVTVAGARRSTGVVSGVGAVRLAGAALGTALFVMVLAVGDGAEAGAPFARAMVRAVMVAGVVAAVGAAAAFALPRAARPRQRVVSQG